MFLIKNKLSLSYRRVKSMHFPESPKVTPVEQNQHKKHENDPLGTTGINKLGLDN